MEVNNELLIIGQPRSGKTTFLAQLYGRLINRVGKLKLVETPDNIEAIKNAYDRLANGQETEPTPSTENLEVQIKVMQEDQEFILHCKDYGGEQVRDLVSIMEYDKTWTERAKNNDRWILFVRPSEIEHRFDLSKKGFAKQDNGDKKEVITGTSDQSHFIELIQVLLHARETGMKEPIKNPRLLIVLTCWDELNTKGAPEIVLQQKMPLFYQFITTNWVTEKFKIIGISAQEFPLKSEEARDKYLDELPENFGYLVFNNNHREKDLTRLIVEALKL